jgi:hypothetical protein
MVMLNVYVPVAGALEPVAAVSSLAVTVTG